MGASCIKITYILEHSNPGLIDRQKKRTYSMTAILRTTAALIFVVALNSGTARAEDLHLGVIEYEISCLPCHGIDGRGGGPLAKSLTTVPADLTKITKSNKGVFPTKKIAEVIDGRAVVWAHGNREMPVWGMRYHIQVETNESQKDIEQRVQSQISALVRYLETMQER